MYRSSFDLSLVNSLKSKTSTDKYDQLLPVDNSIPRLTAGSDAGLAELFCSGASMTPSTNVWGPVYEEVVLRVSPVVGCYATVEFRLSTRAGV